MSHISKKRLDERVEKILKNKLVDVLEIIGKSRGVKYSLNELLTFTEGVMLAKRLAIIYLIYKDRSVLEIAETLNVSTSTVIRIWKLYDRGGYQNLGKVFRKLEPSILDMIEILLTVLPSKTDYHRRLRD